LWRQHICSSCCGSTPAYSYGTILRRSERSSRPNRARSGGCPCCSACSSGLPLLSALLWRTATLGSHSFWKLFAICLRRAFHLQPRGLAHPRLAYRVLGQATLGDHPRHGAYRDSESLPPSLQGVLDGNRRSSDRRSLHRCSIVALLSIQFLMIGLTASDRASTCVLGEQLAQFDTNDGKLLFWLLYAVLQLAAILDGIEVTLRCDDESIRSNLPDFEATDVDFVPSSSRPAVRAD